MSTQLNLNAALSFLHKPSNQVLEEFEHLPNQVFDYGLDSNSFPQFSEGLEPRNLCKNRYTNIIPNNATRVKLENSDDDYINANHCLENRVIIAQGPMHGRHTEFYHMVWTNQSSAIAMLTNYIEKNFPKCSYYLPQDKITKIAGEYEIRSQSDRSVQEPALAELDIKITKLFIKSKSGEERTVTQYHFPFWEDSKGTAEKVVAALARTLLKETKPVIHCSAGIGRSGTLAAVMDAYAQIKAGHISDDLVPKVVTKLRSERHGCVQTAPQYQTIYIALQTLVKEDTEVQTSTPSEKIPTLSSPHKRAHAAQPPLRPKKRSAPNPPDNAQRPLCALRLF
jgi:protein tyrosine phosphatase